MVESSTFFTTLLQGTATSISIVLVFVITIYATRRTILQELNLRFEEEVRELSNKYYGQFEEFSSELSSIDSDAIDYRLMFNASVDTENLTSEKIATWASNAEKEELAGAFGHILVSVFSLESFFASPYIGYKKEVFENLGDHLIDARSCLWSDEARSAILSNTDITEGEYDEFTELIDNMIDEWVAMETKNYTVDVADKDSLFSILTTCKWLFIMGVLTPLLFLIYLPPSLIAFIGQNVSGVLPLELFRYSGILIFVTQIVISFVIVFLVGKLLKQLYGFFNSFEYPKSPNIGLEDAPHELPKVPREKFKDN